MLLIAEKMKPEQFSKQCHCCCCGGLHIKTNISQCKYKGFMELIFFKSNLCLRLNEEALGECLFKGNLEIFADN